MLRNGRVALFALAFGVCLVVALNGALTRAQPAQNRKARPYQFGFTIDEQQHRFEKQDERGIVMGEFGFITADGIYHVTVYATDEEGKFRILSMKSYPYESPPKTIEMIVKPKAKAPATTATTSSPLPTFNSNTKACSGCFIPKEGSKSAETPPKTPIRTLSKSLPDSKASLPGQSIGGNFNNPSLTNSAKTQTTSKTSSAAAKTAGTPRTTLLNGQKSAAAPSAGKQLKTAQNNSGGVGSKGSSSGTGSGIVGSGVGGSGIGRSGVGRSSNSAANSNSGRNGSVGSPAPGSKSSTAAGDAGDLYRFKYLLDYNGHAETGARNGNKRGNYFAIGDDNVQRTVEYIANEFGFQPHVSWRKLDSGTKLPRENALKDYEFVWFTKDQ